MTGLLIFMHYICALSLYIALHFIEFNFSVVNSQVCLHMFINRCDRNPPFPLLPIPLIL